MTDHARGATENAKSRAMVRSPDRRRGRMSNAFKPTYSFTNFSVPNGFETSASGINDLGQIVGTALVDFPAPATPKTVGYIDNAGGFTTIDVAGSTQTDANAVNNWGQVAGFYTTSTSEHGFVYSAGKYTTIDVPGASATVVSGINDFGQISGQYQDSTGLHGFVDTNGHFKTIDVPGATSTGDLVINDLGQILGQYNDSTGPHSFLDNHGHFTTIAAPGATSTQALGLNNLGKIVGDYEDPSGSHTFLETHGQFTTLSAPDGSTLSGINDLGQIVGTTLFRGLLGTPTGHGGSVFFHDLRNLIADVLGKSSLADVLPALPGRLADHPGAGGMAWLSTTSVSGAGSHVFGGDTGAHGWHTGSTEPG
jgi:hypothetical protein